MPTTALNPSDGTLTIEVDAALRLLRDLERGCVLQLHPEVGCVACLSPCACCRAARTHPDADGEQ